MLLDQDAQAMRCRSVKLQAARHIERQLPANFRMRTRIRGFAGVVQQQREIKNEWAFERLENVVILVQRRFGSAPDAVQLFDAAQGVLVGSILMIELVLNQTSKLAEFGQILPKQADFVHCTKN